MLKIFIEDLKTGYADSIAKGFAYISNQTIKPSDRILIKPNLTYPTFREGVMTNPEAIEALVIFLKNFTNNIIICEADSGGYNKFSMDEVFRKVGIDTFAHRYGIRIINLSNEKSKNISVSAGFKKLAVSMPAVILDETDLFISMPVPKVHLNSIVSIAIKNQWGIIQQPSQRLKLHPYFKEVIYSVNKSLPRTITVVDGKYGLTRSGPLRGDVIQLNWLLMGNDIFCTDFMVTKLMGFDYKKIPYLRYIFEKEYIDSPDKDPM